MHRQLAEQWEQVQKELAQRLAEAERIADCLIELGKRLKQEPWRPGNGWLETAAADSATAYLLEPEIQNALNRQHLMWLLDEIRILKRREAELKKLVAA